MGGWVANSKHDFFSIKNYDIIKGGWVTDFHVIIFKLSFFHKSPYDFPFFLTLSWRNKDKGKRHGRKTWQKVIWLIQSSKYKSRMKPSSVYYTLYVNNLLTFMYPIPLDTVENEPQKLYFFLFCHNYLRVGGYLRSDDFVIELFVIIR